MIRALTTTAISTYYNLANGNAQSGAEEFYISLKDFPTNEEVFTSLQTNGSFFIDPDTSQKITGTDINSNDYNICWFSVKYQKNGWRVSGVLLKNGVLVTPEKPQYLTAQLLEPYVPQYKELKTATIPVKGGYLSKLVFTPIIEELPQVIETEQPKEVTQEEEVIVLEQTPRVQSVVQTVIQNTLPDLLDNDNVSQYYIEEQPQNATTRPTSAVESIIDNSTPLAAGLESKDSTPTSWALMNLIFMIINILTLIIIPRIEKRKDIKKQYRSNIIGIILAIAAIIVFIFTQNIYMPMVIVDQWTILMGAFAIGGILNKIFGYKKVKD